MSVEQVVKKYCIGKSVTVVKNTQEKRSAYYCSRKYPSKHECSACDLFNGKPCKITKVVTRKHNNGIFDNVITIIIENKGGCCSRFNFSESQIESFFHINSNRKWKKIK